MSAEAQGPPLTYEDTVRILARLHGQGDLVLVGGQAVNFWATYYLDRAPELAEKAPYTSKDIDFSASHAAVKECAKRLGGTARLASLDDMNTPNTGTVVFVDYDGYERQIDFLTVPAGLVAEEVTRTSFPARILGDDGSTAATFHVLHPVLSLRSRIHNVAFIDGYQTPHALNQLRAAIVSAREYVLEAIEAGEIDIALKANERNYKTVLYRGGAEVYVRHGIDAFGALVDDERLPTKFSTEQYPRMHANVQRRYKRAANAVQRALDLEARRAAHAQRGGR